ncbi:MAG: DUF4215 domain-containing protein [Myxococcota bacterium]
MCGDATREGTEECDDGNGNNGDGCETDCTFTCASGTGAYAVGVRPSGECYATFSTARNWAGAFQTCVDLGGHLVVISSLAERQFVLTLRPPNATRMWMGLHDFAYEANTVGSIFMPITREALTYQAWTTGEPNQYGGNEDCAEFYSGGAWNDQGCSTSSPFACEFPATPFSVCGDGNQAGSEECDDGNLANGDGCNAICDAEPTCGNSRVNPLEQCDDGNTLNGDGCDNNCTLTGCGNGVVTQGEQCDDGNAVNGDGCDSNCTLTACGNGIPAGNERCDDGNTVDGDGCDNNCTATGCGNGVLTSGEECDDGNLVDGDGCDGNCTLTACGNQVVTPGEECDDGNDATGDGCSDCALELEIVQELEPNETPPMPVGMDLRVRGYVEPVGDVDNYIFQLEAGHLYLFETWLGTVGECASQQDSADTVLTLFTADLAYLAEDDDGGLNTCSALSWQPAASGDYVLQVTESNQDQMVLGYLLTLRCLDCVPE